MKTSVPANEQTQRKTPLAAQPKPVGAHTESTFEDARPEAAKLQGFQEMAGNSPRIAQLKSLQATMLAGPRVQQLQSLQAMANHSAAATAQKRTADDELPAKPMQRAKGKEALQGRFERAADTVQRKAAVEAPRSNNTGLPDNLKSGIESLSGMSMDHVKVHYNSAKPAQLQAHAYAQGSEIQLAPGQETHLPHEAWHVVQQARGRVRPTMQMKGNALVNDDAGLEREADLMGSKAVSAGQLVAQKVALSTSLAPAANVVQRAELASDKLNVAGENHGVSGGRRPQEAAYSTEMTGGGYWTEAQFKVSGVSNVSADDFELRAKNLIAFGKEANLGYWITVDSDALVAGLISNKIDIATLELPLTLFRPDELELYKDHIPVQVYNEYNETLLNKGGTFTKCIGTIKTTLAEYTTTGEARWRGKLLEAVQLYQILFSLVDIQINQVMEALAIVSSADVSLQRSGKMHVAANGRAATLGLWKVGDKHTQDMVGMNPKSYKHLLVGDFDAGYNLFIARRAALASIGTVANGNWSPYTKWKSTPTGVAAIRGIINGAGASPTASVLRAVKVRATADSTRASSNRDAKTTSFYAALSAMDVDNTVSMTAIPGLMTGINL